MIIRCVKVKVFHPGNKRAVTHRTIAPKGKHFLAEHVELILAGYVDKIEAKAPGLYRMVQVGPGEFNFVHDGTALEQMKALALALPFSPAISAAVS